VHRPNFIKLREDIEPSSLLANLFQSSDISLRFEIQAAQMEVVSNLKFEFLTNRGARGNFRKWISTTSLPP